MSESRVYKLPENISVDNVAQYVESFFRTEKGMIVQSSPVSEGYIIQATSEQNGWKTISGTKLAISVQLTSTGDTLVVQTGEGQWADKIGAGALAWFVAWPLAITAGIGISRQKKLPKEVMDSIDRYIYSGGKTVVVGGPSGSLKPGAGEAICPGCGIRVPDSTVFCTKCGTKIHNYIQCPSCNASLPAGSEFCSTCGAKVNQKVLCKKCGAELSAGSQFCNKCGQPQT